MQETITIEEKFRGPPVSGNGGYVGGVFSALLESPDDDAEVTLRSPIPLDKPMQVLREDNQVIVMDGETLIAVAKPVEIIPEIPDPPRWDAVRAAEPLSYSLIDESNPLLPGRRGFHPICFCCGAEHEDGLRVFAAPVEGTGQVAAVWETKAEWANEDGGVPREYLWTALDCPGQFAFMAAGIRTGMLGRITARVFSRPAAGEPLLVTAWPIEVDGKKHFAGAAIHDEAGELVARAITVWIGQRD